MKRRVYSVASLLLLGVVSLFALGGCSGAHADPAAGAPPDAKVITVAEPNLFTVDHPEQFPVTPAVERAALSEMVVTGTVMPDIARNIPVISLASGRVVSIHARLGDIVKKGQLLLKVQSTDISGAFSDYRKAVNDERLARVQLERAQLLYDNGAISKSALEVFEDAEQDAQVTLETTLEHLHLLGVNKDHPTGLVNIYAPVSGVITDQQVTNAAGVQALGANPFTISDLSSVWVVCDVYENDLPNVRPGDTAEISLNAFPDRTLRGKVSNIGATLDPSIRTAKVRIEVANPGMMKVGMFAKAIFHGQKKEMHTMVPASAVMHMHDRDFVFVPAPERKFRRIEVVSGPLVPENMSLQEIKSGLHPGQEVVTNALVLDHVLSQ